MTAAEITFFSPLPPKIGWMACHFSPYGTGLSNLPRHLPEGALLILNDRTPICGHDPEIIAKQLCERVEALKCRGVLLDFQRPDVTETGPLAGFLSGTLSCPVGVSERCAEGLGCPVFLPPVPADTAAEDYLRPWQGREIWLEMALEGMDILLTPDGARRVSMPCCEMPHGCFQDERIHCHYRFTLEEDMARCSLYRTREDMDALLAEAEALGVTRAVGLWQELR